ILPSDPRSSAPSASSAFLSRNAGSADDVGQLEARPRGAGRDGQAGDLVGGQGAGADGVQAAAGAGERLQLVGLPAEEGVVGRATAVHIRDDRPKLDEVPAAGDEVELAVLAEADTDGLGLGPRPAVESLALVVAPRRLAEQAGVGADVEARPPATRRERL